MNQRLFQAYVMVDWSAASKPTTGPDSIWVGVLKRNVRFQMAFEAHNPPTRLEAEKLLNGVLDDLKRKSERVLVGFDFPLGFPRGTAAALKSMTSISTVSLTSWMRFHTRVAPATIRDRPMPLIMIAARGSRAAAVQDLLSPAIRPGTGPDLELTFTAVSVPESAFTETTRSTGTEVAPRATLVLTLGLAALGVGVELDSTSALTPGPAPDGDESPEPHAATARDTAARVPRIIGTRARVVDIRLPVEGKDAVAPM